MPDSLVVCRLGRIGYPAAWDLQRRVQARLIAAKRAGEADGLPHVALVVEHPPVYTLGKNGDAAHLLRSEAALAEVGATFVPTDRGGDITFHGPGQLVVYPILDLDRIAYADGTRGSDIHRYLRELEEAIIETCATYGLDAGRVDGRTGVWIGPDGRGPERKVCAMGIRCSRWVTMHGLALNVSTDLGWFDHIVPCGIADRGVTSLAEETPQMVTLGQAADRLLPRLALRFGLATTERRGDAAHAWLDAFAAPEAVG
ncbi:MAG: lipoyl(octanoyl) transferase LipB [Bacteroidota bacterium]